MLQRKISLQQINDNEKRMHRQEITSTGGNDKKECGLNYVMITAMRFFIKCFLTKQKYNHMEGATQILPVIDISVLQEKANEFAMKGAIETLKEFYSGYNSPYRKAIEEDLRDDELGVESNLQEIATREEAREVEASARGTLAAGPVIEGLEVRMPVALTVEENLALDAELAKE